MKGTSAARIKYILSPIIEIKGLIAMGHILTNMKCQYADIYI